MKKGKLFFLAIAILFFGGFAIGTSGAHAVDLFWEDFDGITGFPGGGDPRIDGVSTTNGSTDGNSKTIGDADNDWYGARIEYPMDGAVWQDVGAQEFGGGSNNSIVGKFEDDAGLLFQIDATGFMDITLDFDWRTFSTDKTDKVVVGYYVGDLLTDAG